MSWDSGLWSGEDDAFLRTVEPNNTHSISECHDIVERMNLREFSLNIVASNFLESGAGLKYFHVPISTACEDTSQPMEDPLDGSGVTRVVGFDNLKCVRVDEMDSSSLVSDVEEGGGIFSAEAEASSVGTIGNLQDKG